MQTSTQPSAKPLAHRNPIGFLIAFVALLGFLDATYLTVQHYRNVVPPCQISGCEVVLTSGFATVGSIPVALLGSLYYLFILGLALVYLDTKNEKLLRLAAYTTTAGLAASLYFLYIQAAILHHYCQYCLVSLGTSTTLFALGMVYLARNKKSA